MAQARRVEGKAVKLDKSLVDQLDLSTIPMGKLEETAEVSAQWTGSVRDPYTGEWYFFEYLVPGWHIFRDPQGNVWSQFIP
jgi:hypothetical protein